jgi:copper(I)-binding protein
MKSTSTTVPSCPGKVSRLLPAALLALSASLACAQPATVSEPWARATVQGQKAAGVFMRLDVPVGKTVELKPGGYHVMLMDLKMPLLKDTTIPLALVFVDAKGVESRTELTVPVRAMGQMAHNPSSH